MNRKITAVKVTHPEYMAGDFATKVLSLYKQVEELENKCDESFRSHYLAELELKKAKAELGSLSGLYELEYEEEEPKEFIKGEAPGIVESNGTIHV